MANCDFHDPRLVVDRATRLERQNRRLWWALLGLAGLAFGALTSAGIAAPKAPPVVEASQFVLRDAEGSKRGELVVDPDGKGRMVLYGQDGQITAELPLRSQAFPVRH